MASNSNNNEALITPIFKAMAIKDEAATKKAGRPIFKDVEMVEIVIAGDRHFRPTVGAHDFWKNIEGEAITYAMRWPDQYRRFKEGRAQTAEGTPVEELPFLTQAKRYELKALGIYTADALAALDGKNLKTLGIGGRELKDQARAYLDNAHGSANVTAMARELAAVRAELEAMRADAVRRPEPVADMPVAPELLDPPSEFESWSDEELKLHIAGETGSRPLGNPSHETLVKMADELAEKQAA